MKIADYILKQGLSPLRECLKDKQKLTYYLQDHLLDMAFILQNIAPHSEEKELILKYVEEDLNPRITLLSKALKINENPN